MKPTLIKVSISHDGLLPQQSIKLGETVLQNFPKKLITALDFEKVDDDKKKTTFVGILPVFVVIGEKTQEIDMELTVAHPELRSKVVDIFTSTPPPGYKSVAKPKAEVKNSADKQSKQTPSKELAKVSKERAKPKETKASRKKKDGGTASVKKVSSKRKTPKEAKTLPKKKPEKAPPKGRIR